MIGEEFTFFGKDIVETAAFLQLYSNPNRPGGEIKACHFIETFGQFPGCAPCAATQIECTLFCMTCIFYLVFCNLLIVIFDAQEVRSILSFARANYFLIDFINILWNFHINSRFHITETCMLVKMTTECITRISDRFISG